MSGELERVLDKLDEIERRQKEHESILLEVVDMLSTQVAVNRNIEKHLRRISGDPGLYIQERREAANE